MSQGLPGVDKPLIRTPFKVNQGFTLESIELPDSYEETCLFLMAVEPHLVHAIWDVDPEELKEIKDQGHDSPHPVRFILRFHDVTDTIFSGENSRASFDVEIDLSEKKRYVPLRNAGRAYLAEIGTIIGTGSFSPLARSNVTETPRIGTTPQLEPRFAVVQEVAVPESVVTDVPPETMTPDRLRAGQEIVSITNATMDDDVDPAVVQGRVPATGVIMKEEQEETLPGDVGNTFAILARDVLMRAGLFHRPRADAEQVMQPGIPATRVIQERRQIRASGADLTESSEKKFVAGISSK
jgi:hypothetical protein